MLRTTFLFHCIMTLCVAQSSESIEYLDTFEPIVRLSPESDTFADDYFGYTVVLHSLVENGNMDDVRIVVSAPYGEAVGTKLPRVTGFTSRVKGTGVIYTCRLTPSVCVGLTGDGNGHDRRLYDLDDNGMIAILTDGNQAEEKRGQFLGATLKSTGDTFLTCSHRYLDYGVGLNRSPYGVCYHSGRSLRGFKRYGPCSTQSRSQFGHGQCQAGVSADIINGSILVGAPGAYAWRGSVFRQGATGIKSGSDNGVGSSSHSYQGFEVGTARISSSNPDFLVVAPRHDNYRGRINIYPNQRILRPVGNPPLAGEQVGESYGFSLAAADLQGRGKILRRLASYKELESSMIRRNRLDDLLVGAPLHSPSGSSPEFGRVYVYKNDQGALSRYTTLEGSISYGRFGHAMANLDDINGDGYDDIAISAPFGMDRSGNALPGTVYIYAGAGKDVVRQTPIQAIAGNELNLKLSPPLNGSVTSFGFSLSSNVDVDNNGLNDLVIGAFRSQRVYVLRARPVARVQIDLDSDDKVDLTIMPCSGQPCFNISVCMTYETGSQNIQQSNTIVMNYTLQVDPQLIQAGLPNRVDLRMSGQSSGSGSTIKDSIILMQGGGSRCISAQAVVVIDTMEVKSPFMVQFTPSLEEIRQSDSIWDGNMSVNSLDNSPVLFTTGATLAVTQYVTNCGNNTCRPDMQVSVMDNGIQYEDNDGNVVNTNSIVSGIVTSLEIPVLVRNNGEDAFGARIAFTFNSVLVFSRAAPANERAITLTCSTTRGTVNSSAECLIQNMFEANASRVLIFRFQATTVTATEGQLLTIFEVTSQPSESADTLGDNRDIFNILTQANADLRVQASVSHEAIVVGETNPTMIIDVSEFAPISSVFSTTFSITNLGTTRVPLAQLSIFWPLNTPENDNQNYYLYPIRTDDGLSCNTAYINIEQHDLELFGKGNTQLGKRRRRRRTVEVTNTTQVSCADGVSDSCVEIICNITNLQRSASVTIDAIPDNRQFYETEENWKFTIHAEVEILSFGDTNLDNNEDSVTVVGIPVIIPPTSESAEIAAWVIIVPIVIGVLVINVIVIALYFLGFFKLKKVDKEKDQEELEELNQYGGIPGGNTLDEDQPEARDL